MVFVVLDFGVAADPVVPDGYRKEARIIPAGAVGLGELLPVVRAAFPRDLGQVLNGHHRCCLDPGAILGRRACRDEEPHS
ncbi:hypothetical protein D9M72_591770 [compost metagenome]